MKSSATKAYKLKQPLLGWAKGEQLTYDPEWNEWTRKKTGERFTLRSSIKEGEVVLLLNYLSEDMTSIMEAL